MFSDIFVPAEGLHEQGCGTEINRTFLKCCVNIGWLQGREIHGWELGQEEEFLSRTFLYLLI